MTSLTISKQLYAAFPEWDDTHFFWVKARRVVDATYYGEEGEWVLLSNKNINYLDNNPMQIPAYDSDYLLGKLPQSVQVTVNGEQTFQQLNMAKDDLKDSGGVPWLFRYGNNHSVTAFGRASTPADALGLLALKLREEGLL